MARSNSRAENPSPVSLFDLPATSTLGTKIQANQDPLGIGQVTDDLLDRLGQPPHQGRNRENLVALGQLRLLDQIDDLDVILAFQMLFADLLQILKRRDRLGRGSCDVEPEIPGRLAGRCSVPGSLDGRGNCPHFTLPWPPPAESTSARRLAAITRRSICPLNSCARRLRTNWSMRWSCTCNSF